MPDIDSLRPLRRAFTFRYVADSVSVDQDIRPLLFEDSERRVTGLAVRLNSLRILSRQTVAENRSCPEKKDRSRHENKNLPLLFHRRPVDSTPVIFDLIKKVFRHASMCEYEFSPSAGSGSERNGGHRVNALGKILPTPRLDEASSRHEIHIHSGDLTCVRGELAADLVAEESFATGDLRALTRVGKQVVDRLRWNFEANFMLDGFTHRAPPFSSAYPRPLVDQSMDIPCSFGSRFA